MPLPLLIAIQQSTTTVIQALVLEKRDILNALAQEAVITVLPVITNHQGLFMPQLVIV
jgi:hypothetical protein